MKRIFFAWLALLAVLAANPCHAAVFERDWKVPGDGLLTYDDVNQREWLDLSISRLDQFPAPRLENAIAEIAPGGLFEGFKWAERSDVIAFAQSAGIDTSSWNFAVNEPFTSSLIDLLEPTFQSSTSLHSTGYLDEIVGTFRAGADFFVQFNPSSGEGSTAGLYTSSSNDWLHVPATGLMLYRNIPEPSTGVLMLMLAVAAGILGITARSRN